MGESVQINTRGITTLGALGLLLVACKLGDVIDWSWWLVLMPFYIGTALGLMLFIGFLASYLLVRLIEGDHLPKVPRPSLRSRISTPIARALRQLARRLDALDDDRFLHQQIARAFNMPPCCRYFVIRWEVGHPVLITTESFLTKGGGAGRNDGPVDLEKLAGILTQQSKLVEVGRFERPL